MALPLPIAEYAGVFDLDLQDLEGFEAAHPEPALHVGGLPLFQRLPSATSEFTTRVDSGPPTPPDKTPFEGGLLRLRKSDRPNASASGMITLGRTENNDLVLPDERVSKFHGYFQSGERWSFTDAGSTNGTLMDGMETVPMRPYPLEPGTSLVLSSEVTLVYLTPKQLFRLLRRG